jgi:hypothetical protein
VDFTGAVQKLLDGESVVGLARNKKRAANVARRASNLPAEMVLKS